MEAEKYLKDLEKLAKFEGYYDKRYGFVAETTLKGRKIFMLKPTTFIYFLILKSLLLMIIDC